MNFVIVTIESC